ncbi:hypothetical protein SGRIM128S_01510 [Streptomyces griseomycini]
MSSSHCAGSPGRCGQTRCSQGFRTVFRTRRRALGRRSDPRRHGGGTGARTAGTPLDPGALLRGRPAHLDQGARLGRGAVRRGRAGAPRGLRGAEAHPREGRGPLGAQGGRPQGTVGPALGPAPGAGRPQRGGRGRAGVEAAPVRRRPATGLSVGLALLPWAGSGPTDDRPLPATSPTPPPAVGPTPTASVPGATASTSRPATSPPATADAGTTVPAGDSTPTFAPPPAATAEGERAAPTSTPPVPPPPTSPPPSSSEPSGEPSVPAGHESAGSG